MEKLINKKIAFILGSMGSGGAEKVVSVLANNYADSGWNVDIIVLLSNKIEYELHSNINLIDFSGYTQSRIKRLPYWLKNLHRYTKMNKPDVVLSFVARINIISYLACRRNVRKLYVSERNDPKCDGRSRLVDILTKLLYPRVNGVVFQTVRAKNYFPKLKNGVIIANPISVEMSATQIKEKKIVTVGRLSKQKNHHMLIDAFAEVALRFPEYRLEIYGEGELRQELQEHINKVKLKEQILLMGTRKNIHKHIASAEVFVLSSDYEGLSNALLEAMTMGIPCISTNCAGSDEYIKDGENGLLVSVGNKDVLANAMIRMLENNEFRKQCGINAAADAKKYGKDTVLQQWHNLMG